MKNTKSQLKRMLLTLITVIFAFFISRPDASLKAVVMEPDNTPVLQDADYISNDPLEWYNYFEETESCSLRDDQKRYSAILNASNGVFNRYAEEPAKITDDGGIIATTTNAFEYVCYDYPELKLLKYKFDYLEDHSFKVILKNEEEYHQKIGQIDSIIQDLVDEVNQETSLICKYRLINDWLVRQIEYDFHYAEITTKKERWTDEDWEYLENCNSDNIYGAIVNKFAVCSGISEAFKYICSKCNLRCKVVDGKAKESHEWNVVPIYDNYFLIDCTWELKSNIDYGTYYVRNEDTKMLTIKTFNEHNYFLLNNLWDSERTIYNTQLDKLFKTDSYHWVYSAATAEACNGLMITLPMDYEFCSKSDSYLVYGLTSEGYSKLFAGEDYDEVEFKTNGQIEHVIYLDGIISGRINSVKDFVGTDHLYSDDISECCIVVVRYEGELYSIKLIQTGM